jgi:prepilin-type N-terminal cleavage/methylation domain-containing protein
LRGLKPAVRDSGVTLLEMLIVVTIVALLAGVTYPSIAAGLDSLRLRSASDSIVAFLNTALDHAERRQQAVEIRIAPRESDLSARSADAGFSRDLRLPNTVRIVNPADARRFLLYPGGSVPAITIDLATPGGRHRTVSIDPITGVPQSEVRR